MSHDDMRKMFNRAASHTVGKAKLLFVFCVLALCGLMVVFFRGLAINAGRWVAGSLTFLPFFISAGLMLATGIVLTRVYHDELKGKSVSLWKTVTASWELMASATYFTVPLVLAYLLLWMVLGLFHLLGEIPVLGDSLGVLLAFGPFLLNLCSLLLCVLTLALLFFATPAVALLGANRQRISSVVLQRLGLDPFSNLLSWAIGLLPLAFVAGLLTLAGYLSTAATPSIDRTVHVVIEWFIIMIPFTALLTPAIVFFFNFAAEAHVLMRQKMRQAESQKGSPTS